MEELDILQKNSKPALKDWTKGIKDFSFSRDCEVTLIR